MTDYRRNRKTIAIRTAAASALLAIGGAVRADYVYSGPNNGQWSDISNWTYVHSDGAGGLLHDPMTFYPGAAGTDLTVTTNINNGIANSNLNFNIGSGNTAHIARLYLG